MQRIAPVTPDELSDAIADATRSGAKLEIRGGGSKAEIGCDRDAALLDMRGFAGIIDYDPQELVITVGAGTPLSEIEELVRSEQQMLAFEPWDHGPLFGRPAGAATIGGVVASAVAGSRRLTAGGARDHLLGFEAVSGRAESFVAGARVVKNVTGYDLPKVMAGSWGRLAAMTRLTLKVLPRPRTTTTMIVEGLSARQAQAAMACAMGSHVDVSAAAHLPAEVNEGRAITAFRLQGFKPSVDARSALLPGLLRDYGTPRRLGESEVDGLWDAVRIAAPLSGGSLWRVNVPPSRGCDVVAALEPLGARWLFDWAGGLLWLCWDGDAGVVRQAAERSGGHAMLVRAPADQRATVAAQHPRPPGLAALEHRVRRAFDPAGIFETGRF